jgi:hypothetical protein
MTDLTRARARWLVVVAFAIGMAWVESATVYYLRTVVDRVEPYQSNPLPFQGVFGPVELAREAATLVMLLTVGMLAGATWRMRLAYTSIAFGFWDIFYYVFLWLICGWPRSLFDWDILFLLPLPWWGPVLAPVCIALLMVVWGTHVTQWTDPQPAAAVPWAVWSSGALGVVLALYVFMADSLRHVQEGRDAGDYVLPTVFNWPTFAVALVLMAVPLASKLLPSINQVEAKNPFLL